MISFDEDALICDLAETYKIYDYRSLPVHLVATLSYGLREDSRILTKLRGVKVGYDTLLLARITDLLGRFLIGEEHELITPEFVDLKEENNSSDIETFDSVEDFKAELERRLRG